MRDAIADELRAFRRGALTEGELVARLREIIGAERASIDDLAAAITIKSIGPDGNTVRDVHAWIKQGPGAKGASLKLITRFFDRAGRFTYAYEKEAGVQPFGPGALALRSRGLLVTESGVPRYLLECLGYPIEKIEAAITVLHGPKGPPPKASGACNL